MTQVLATGVLADDHALVDLVAGLDEQDPALLEVVERERGDPAPPVGDQRPGRPGPQLAVPRLPAVEHVVHEPGPARLGQERSEEHTSELQSPC